MKRKSRELIVLVDVVADLSQAPTEFRLLPYGEVRTTKGTFTNDEQAMNDMIAAFHAHGIDLVCDYEHQTLSGEQAPAAGWITRLVNKGREGLWAIVNWTERAKQYLADREYRYFSPVFRAVKESGRIAELHSVGLTNKPAILDLAPLVAKDDGMAEEPDQARAWLERAIARHQRHLDGTEATDKASQQEMMNEMMKALEALGGEPGAAHTSPPQGEHAMKQQIIKLLTLKADATEADVETAIKELQALKAKGADAVAVLAANKDVLAALELKEDATQSTVVATIHALKQTARTAAPASEVQALKDRLAKRDADDLVAAAMEAGKITPAQKDWADTYALKDPEGFTVFVDKSPVVVPLKNAPESKSGAETNEAEQDRLIALAMEKDKVLSYKDALKKVAKERPDLFATA